MSLNSLDHCSIRTVMLDAARAFFADTLGMDDGDRPHFLFPVAWLYGDVAAVLHLVVVDPDDTSGLEKYLGGATDAASLTGSGAFDHIAFRAKDPDVMIGRMKEKGYPFRERQVPDMDLFQVFVDDPNGITVELDYWAEDQKAA